MKIESPIERSLMKREKKHRMRCHEKRVESWDSPNTFKPASCSYKDTEERLQCEIKSKSYVKVNRWNWRVHKHHHAIKCKLRGKRRRGLTDRGATFQDTSHQASGIFTIDIRLSGITEQRNDVLGGGRKLIVMSS